jgi:tetratricopeptide (TPR) repeat protein
LIKVPVPLAYARGSVFSVEPFVVFRAWNTLFLYGEVRMKRKLLFTRPRLVPFAWLAGAVLAVCAYGAPKEERIAPLLEGIGELHHPITTSNSTAQKYFDQALTLSYAFNHLEAERSFQQVALLDPDCAMAYWGQALVLGPNINDPSPDAERERKAYDAMQQALARADKASEKERAMIRALAARYSTEPDRKTLNAAYAEAMGKLAKQYPDDADIQVLFAASLMEKSPWDYWLPGEQPKPETKEFLAVLDDVIAKHPNHVGVHHYYIHAVEAADPDRAEASADKLGGMVPVAGHLVHMPGHIYIRVGRYEDAAEANRKAIVADESYISQCRAQGLYPVAYYPHNIHFLWAALTMQGRGKEAMEAAMKVASQHTSEHMHESGFGFPHLLKTVPTLAMVRFGLYGQVLAQPEPPEEAAFGRGVWHFARGMALRSQGKITEAQQELAALREYAARPELAELKIFDVNSLAPLLAIATKILDGELAAARGEFDKAEALFREGVKIEDALLYSEPPDWPQPVRHSLGAVLLKAGHPAEAETVYREDLKRHRNNGWALFGLAQSLRAQGKTAEAEQAEHQFREAWAGADTKLTASRF